MDPQPQQGPWNRRLFEHAAARYLFALVVVAAAYLLRKLLEPITGTGAPFVLFFGAVLVVNIAVGAGPGIFATALSMVLGAIAFVVRAGYAPSNALWQALLFGADGLIAVYLAYVLKRERQRAERARDRLQRSERDIRELIELAPDAFFLADLDARFLDVNRAACRLLGYSREELVGKTILDIIPPEDAPRLSDVKARLLQPGLVDRGEWRQLRKDGTRVTVEISANILPDGRWQAFARDITERRRLEDERQMFVALLENSSDFIGIADPSGKPLWVNPAGRRMVGLPDDLPIERTQIPDYYPADIRASVPPTILTALCDSGRWAGETYFRNWQSEASIPVSDEHFMIRDPQTGRLLGMGTVTRDISEARRVSNERDQLLARERATNAQLRESEERFRLTLDEAPIGMALVGLDGRFVRVNQALCEITGYSPEELAALRFHDITHPEDLDTDVALAERLARGEIPRYQLEKRYLRKDRSAVWIMLSCSMLRGPRGEAVVYIAQVEDISERKKAEEALRASEERLAGIISIAPDAIISIDETQRITIFNDGAERIFGYARSEVLGGSLDILIPAALRERHRQDVVGFAAGTVAARRMGERRAQVLGLRKNGEEFPAEASISKLEQGGHLTLTVALRDITDRKRREWEQHLLTGAADILGSSLDYARNLTEVAKLAVREFSDWCIVKLAVPGATDLAWKVACSSPDAAAVCTELEDLHINRRWPAFARPSTDLPHAILVERIAPGDLEAIAQSPRHLELLRTMNPSSLIDVPLVIRGQVLGGLLFVSSQPSRRYARSDLELAQALGERATLAVENGRLYEASVQAQRLRDQVLAVVAHDLRNPLAVILSQVEGKPASGEDTLRRMARSRELIQRSARRMNRLIQDLLDVAVIEAGQLRLEHVAFDPRALLKEAVDAQVPLADAASLALELDLPQGLPELTGDPNRLSQVLENLIGNAMKFTPAGGHIRVGAAPRPGEVLFWVADSGAGMAPEDLPHVFDRFWQAQKAKRQGAGLGLPICRGIVEAHGGSIWVESQLGRGSTFFFALPLRELHRHPPPVQGGI